MRQVSPSRVRLRLDAVVFAPATEFLPESPVFIADGVQRFPIFDTLGKRRQNGSVARPLRRQKGAYNSRSPQCRERNSVSVFEGLASCLEVPRLAVCSDEGRMFLPNCLSSSAEAMPLRNLSDALSRNTKPVSDGLIGFPFGDGLGDEREAFFV